MTQQLRYDLLGMIRYKKAAFQAVRPNSAIAVLDRYFRKKASLHDDLYRQILEHPKNLTLVVHGLWSNDHRFDKVDRKAAIKVARRLQNLVDSIPGSLGRVYFSPFLEHRKGVRFMNRTFTKLTMAAPRS